MSAADIHGVIICLCENDEHGMPCGEVTAAHFTDALNYDTPPSLELESHFVGEDDELEGIACTRTGMALFIGGWAAPVRDFRPHVGNLMWNGYVVSLADAQRLAQHLRDLLRFDIMGETQGQPFLVTAFTPPSHPRETTDG